MKNFLDILSHPLKRMPLETLLKCEVVLEKLDFKRGDAMSLHSQTNPLHLQGTKVPPDSTSHCNTCPTFNQQQH